MKRSWKMQESLSLWANPEPSCARKKLTIKKMNVGAPERSLGNFLALSSRPLAFIMSLAGAFGYLWSVTNNAPQTEP
jgi:hypothetical protein